MVIWNIYFLKKKFLDHIQHILDPTTHILDQNHNFGRRNFMKMFTWQIYKNEQGAQIWKKYFRSDSTFFRSNSKNFQKNADLDLKKYFRSISTFFRLNSH